MNSVSVDDSSAKPAKSRSKPKPRTHSAKTTLHVSPKKSGAVLSSHGDLALHIATAAYYLAEQRGFAPGHELEDWLTAEHQVRARLD